MASVMAPLLLALVLLLVFSSGDCTQDCPPADVVVTRGSTSLIMTANSMSDKGNFSERFLLMKPEEGLEMVRLDVEGMDGSQHVAYFSADRECFPADDKWHKLIVGAEISHEDETLDMVLVIGPKTCHKGCTKNNPPKGIRSLTLTAIGSSSWLSPPNTSSCTGIALAWPYPFSTFPTCMDSPPPKSLTLTPTVLYIVAGIAVLGLMLIMVFICRRRQQQQQQLTTPNEVCSASQLAQPAQPADPTNPPESKPLNISVSQEMGGEIYYKFVKTKTTPPPSAPDKEAHTYDTAQGIYDDVQPEPSQEVTDSSDYSNVPVYKNVGDHAQDKQSPPDIAEEPIYSEIV